MIITGVETFPLRIPFKPGTRSAASAWGPAGLHAVDSLLVKVTTDEGLEGWGEAFGFTGVPVTQRAIDAVIAPLCVGRDAARIGQLMGDVQAKLAVFGRGGPFTHALSAMDIARWGIAGKAAGAPLHRLLGGGRDELACYASLDAYADPDLVRAAVRKAVDAGFCGVKLHERDLAVVRGGGLRPAEPGEDGRHHRAPQGLHGGGPAQRHRDAAFLLRRPRATGRDTRDRRAGHG